MTCPPITDLQLGEFALNCTSKKGTSLQLKSTRTIKRCHYMKTFTVTTSKQGSFVAVCVREFFKHQWQGRLSQYLISD